jgi:NADH:ubiquinone oxidoreductase subunit 4 (subunit M)
MRPGQSPEQIGMKLAGFLLLLSGWGIVVSTLPLLPSSGARAAFVLAGMAVELIGLTLVARSHRVPKG